MGRAITVLIVTALLALAASAAWPTARGLSLLVRVSTVDGPLRSAANIGQESVEHREIIITRPAGALRARLYTPSSGARRTIIAVPGLHAAELDEPRLVVLAQELAASGLAVLTPAIPELSDFAITPAITEAIADVVLWAAADPTLAPDGRVGVIGVSFSGGLALIAAGRPAVRSKVAFVFALGAHADLPRVLRYLCTGAMPRPESASHYLPEMLPEPHDYGLAVLVLALTDKLVPADQREALDLAIRQLLHASHLARVDPTAAEREVGRLRAVAEAMPEPSASLLHRVLDRRVAVLGAALLPFLGDVGTDPALSPARSPAPTAPVFLLHGVGDSVIPAFESVYLAEAMRGNAPVRLLITPLISHADVVASSSPREVFELARFAGQVLRQ